VFQHVGIVVCGEQGVHAHRHQTGVHGAQITDRPVVAVEHQDQDTFFAAQTQRAQSCRHAFDAILERAVGERAQVVYEGCFVGADLINAKQMMGEIELLAGGLNVVGCGHEVSVCVEGL
jgi:hypothetical protein